MKTSFLTIVSVLSAIVASTSAFATGENTVTSKSYVDAQDATKQDLIDTDMMTISIPKMNVNTTVPTLVSYDDTNGLTGDSIGLIKTDTFGTYSNNSSDTWWWNNNYSSAIDNNAVPTAGAVKTFVNRKQDKIGGHAANAEDSLLTDSPQDGVVQKRAIYNDTAANYNSSTQSTYIPTMGVMMSTIQDGVSTFRVDSDEITAIQNYSVTFDDTTNNWPNADDGKLVNSNALALGLAEKQNKIAAGTAGNIVTYSGTAGTVGSVATYDGSGTYTAQTDAGKIATAAAVETKQNKIPATGTNASTPGDTVVTYTSTAGTIGERGIYNGLTTYYAPTDSDKLITAGAAQRDKEEATYNAVSQITSQNLESINVPSLTCANQDCTLYQVTTNAGIAHKLYSCTAQTVVTACPACGSGFLQACEDSICKCNACKTTGMVCSGNAECCDGMCDAGVCIGVASGGPGVVAGPGTVN